MSDAFLGFHGRDRIVILGLGHPGQSRIEIVTILLPNNPLNDDRHLLPLRAVGSSGGKRPGTPEVGRSVDQFDSGDELLQSGGKVRMIVGQHVGSIEPGIGLIMIVFQQPRGPDRKGQVHLRKVQVKPFLKPGRELCPQEEFRHVGIREFRLLESLQVVVRDEGIESLGGDHQRSGKGDVHLGILAMQLGMTMEQVGKKDQPSSLAAQ